MTGKGGVLPSLNQKLFMIRRLRNSLNDKGLRKVAESLFISKLRYGLQLFGQVRWTSEETTPSLIAQLQKSQNKLLRFLNKSRISDKISTKSMLEKHNMLAVNQINAQIKLTEMWKAVNDPDHPFKIKKTSIDSQKITTRSNTNGILKIHAISDITKRTFINDGTKVWNMAPDEVKKCTTFESAKRL